MDTDGHSECAEVGAKILQAALAESGRSTWRTTAFYLGNWLTDVSQGVDPVAYDKLAHELPTMLELIAIYVQSRLSIDLSGVADRARAALAVFEGGRDGRAGRAIKKGFKWIAYHKFAHAGPGEASKIHFPAFEHVFDNLYTQYYPHEHLDRWPDAPGPPGVDPSRVYPYLSEQIKIAAGLLAQIDLEWASRAFVRDARSCPWRDDEDPAWNLWLAKLGHALHAVEDFFSHSNFIEHAIEALGPDDPRRKLKPTLSLELVGPSEADIFKRRLTRYADPQGDAAETHVVTGYFGLADSVFSAEHVVHELFPDEPPAVTTAGTRAARLLRAVLEEVQRRTKGLGTVSAEQARSISKQVVAEKIGMKDPEYAALMQENVPVAIQDTFHDAVAYLSAKGEGRPMSLFDAFLLVLAIADASSYPRRFAAWLFGDAVSTLADVVTDPLQKLAEPLIRRAFDNMLGRYSIGSHSLLAKDYTWEGRPKINEIYAEAKKCSKAAHGYVTKLLTRWGRAQIAAVKRTDQRDDPRAFNRIREDVWVDWLELMQYLLRHPSTTEKKLADAWWYASLHGLEDRFRHYRITEAALRAQIRSADELRAAKEAAYVPPQRAAVGGAVSAAAGSATPGPR